MSCSLNSVIRHFAADGSGVVHIQYLTPDIPCPLQTPDNNNQNIAGRVCQESQAAYSTIPDTESQAGGPPSSLMREPTRDAETPQGATLCHICAHASNEHILDWPIDYHSRFHLMDTPFREGQVPIITVANSDPFASPISPAAGPSRPRVVMTQAAQAGAAVMEGDNVVSDSERKRRRKANSKKISELQWYHCQRCLRRDKANGRTSPLSRRQVQISSVLDNVEAPAGARSNSGGPFDGWLHQYGHPAWTRAPIPFNLPKVEPKGDDKGKGKGKESDPFA
ncbi:hypothetical protein SBRCBS47491_005100 [Sporothrix bragantina]|uniref:Uncharacterized protein n=1 Tax=Sporothrix bragantina TaxID=671064 RepID=A0ABP0BUQ9_9PEZI